MKSGMPIREFRMITISNGRNFFTILISVYRPIECFFEPRSSLFEPSVMYFNIFYVN